ncbi:MAG: hypothetical protein ACFFB5_06405 [Promethearchaeota archaeon]
MVQWRNWNRKKIGLLSVGVITSFMVVLAVAIQSNWFNIADLTGTVKKNEVSITKAQISLGNVASGASFETTGTTSITIPVVEKGGQNVSKFLMILPVTSMSDAEDYLIERFASLSLNVTIIGTTYSLGIVIGGELPTTGTHDWDYEDTDFTNDLIYYSYKNWDSGIFLPTGSHEIDLKAFGVTSAPSTDLTIDITFVFELI